MSYAIWGLDNGFLQGFLQKKESRGTRSKRERTQRLEGTSQKRDMGAPTEMGTLLLWLILAATAHRALSKL
jgi:hypothetical protein